MNKLKEIIELEKTYGITLTEIAGSKDIISYGYKNCYQLNNKHEVTGLNLCDNQIREIKGF